MGFDAKHGAIYARIGAPHVSGKSHGWCGKGVMGGAMGEEVTVDLTTSYIVTGVATQARGGSTQWVERYTVYTSEDGHDWKAQGNFRGNFDKSTICRRRFQKPVLASFVKFKVLEVHNHACMRLDVLVHNIGNE